jgi:hypothetical protein
MGAIGIEEEEEEEEECVGLYVVRFVYAHDFSINISLTDLNNALPGNTSVNKVQHATMKEAVFSVDPTDAPVDWLDSDHVICVYCKSMSVPRPHSESREL